MVWCSNCAKNYDPTFHDGFLCCPVCGRVIDQDNFSSEPTFVKNAAGQSLLAGNFVRTVQSDYSASRERILKTAYDNMNNLVRFFAMDDGDMLLRPAVAFYTIALERNFTRGRRRELVEAACLYIACRENKKPFLLIDFSDYLKENVYVLGSTFLQLCKLLSLEEHPIVQKPVDPSLFMHRFASRLLGDGYLVVSKTAVRIIASMKRDWMQTGRKPSGLCGAALYVAALSHGIKCSKSDIVKIVHICEATLTKRLVEFENTKSGSLTIEEFNKKAQELEVLAKQANIVSSVNSTNELLCEHKGTGIAPFAHGLCEPCYRDFLDLSGGLEGDTEPPAFQHAERERMTKECTEENAKSSCFVTVPSQGQENSEQELETVAAIGNKKLQFTEAGKDGASTNHIDEVCFDKFHGVDGKSNKDNDESDNFSDIDDSEVEGYLHNEEEKYYKKILWEEMNWEYIEEQAAKEAAAAAAKKAYEASFSNCPEEMQAAQELAAAAAAAVAKSRKEKQQKRAADAKNSAPAKTAVEATRQMLMKKRLSSKINYDALDKLFDDSVDAQIFKKSRIDSQSDIDEYQPHINKDNKSKISYKDGELAQDDEYDEVGGKVEQEYDETLDYGHVEGGYAYDDNYGYDEY